MKRRVLILIVIVALALAGTYYWQFGPGAEARRDGALTLYGNVDIRDAVLAFRVSGRIETMAVEEGDPVSAGAVMATLDRAPLAQERAAAAADLAAARAELDKLRRGFRAEEREQARARVNEREVALANAERLLRRRRELLADNAVSEEVYDDALAARDAARARLRTARENLQLLTEGYRQEDIRAAEAAVAGAQARLARADIALEDTALRAPADGVVLTRVREPGAVVAAGASVYTLALEAPVWVRAYVDEPDLGLVYPGQPARVYSDSRPGQPYRGQVGFIAEQAEFTPKNVATPALRSDLVFRLRVVVDGPARGLRQGMPVTVELDTRETAAAAGRATAGGDG